MKNCPKCQYEYPYQDQSLWICPECNHEWEDLLVAAPSLDESSGHKFIDSNGVELQQGDSVTVIKNLKVGTQTLKAGTKVKNIRLLDEPVSGHDISCKVDGFGSIYLKCEVVKKA